MEISIDDVKSLGTFLEIEAHAKEEKDIMALAKKLGAEESIRKSHLELLLEKKEQCLIRLGFHAGGFIEG